MQSLLKGKSIPFQTSVYNTFLQQSTIEMNFGRIEVKWVDTIIDAPCQPSTRKPKNHPITFEVQ